MLAQSIIEADARERRRGEFPGAYGRFLQPDPIGYADSPNLYQAMLNDPVNNTDPLGLDCAGDQRCPPIIITKQRDDSFAIPDAAGFLSLSISFSSGFNFGGDVGSGGDTNKDQCAAALKEAKKDHASVARAQQAWPTLSGAALAHGIEPTLLAAVGVRETGFKNIRQLGGGPGVGVFQLTVAPGYGVTATQASNLSWSANYAANMLSNNMNYLAGKFSFTPTQLLQATAASFNIGPHGISGNPKTIDVGTTGGNYGSNVVNLMSCFKH